MGVLKARTMATPPRRGMGCECTWRLELGEVITNRGFTALLRTMMVRTAPTISASRNATKSVIMFVPSSLPRLAGRKASPPTDLIARQFKNCHGPW